MAITNERTVHNREFSIISFTLSAVNDVYSVTLPSPRRESTFQRVLVGPSAATVLDLSSLDPVTVPANGFALGTANSDALVSNSGHVATRINLKCSVFTGSGTVDVVYVCRRAC